MGALIRLLRPHQWTKNVLCAAGVFFSGRWTEPDALWLGALTVLVFCFASSAVYVLNDILDRDRDREHPRKRERPIASGRVSVGAAAVLGIGLAGCALLLASGLHIGVVVCVVLYLANNLAYTTLLKHLALFDVLCIAFGFLMRLLAGVYALDELPTAWITLCTFFLAVFLGFAKRRAELASLAGQENLQRPVLQKYTVDYLDTLLNSAAIMAIMSYALFTVTSGRNPTLIVTIPLVYYAISHYQRLVMVRQAGEEPESILLKEYRIPVLVLIWLAVYITVVYFDLRLFE